MNKIYKIKNNCRLCSSKNIVKVVSIGESPISEKYLNSKVDNRIEVFYKELIDFNKLRLKNSPQRLD